MMFKLCPICKRELELNILNEMYLYTCEKCIYYADYKKGILEYCEFLTPNYHITYDNSNLHMYYITNYSIYVPYFNIEYLTVEQIENTIDKLIILQ